MKKYKVSGLEYSLSIYLLSIVVMFGSVCVFRESIYISTIDLYIDIKMVSTIMLFLSLLNTFFSLIVSYNRTLLDILISALVPFALYSLLFDMQYFFLFGIFVMICVIAVCVIVTILIKRNSIRIKTRKILHVLRYAIFAIMIIPMCVSFLFNTWGDKAVKTNVPVKADMPMQDGSMIKAQIGTLLPLVNGIWYGMGTQERIDILQIIVNIESTYLGCVAVPLVADTLSTYTSACYMHDKKMIAIDLEHLKTAEPEACICSIIHEVRHVYQRQMVESVDWEKEGSSTLAGLLEIHKWKENFENYTLSAENNAYAKQPIESDAYEYSQKRGPEYFEKIKQYSGVAGTGQNS